MPRIYADNPDHNFDFGGVPFTNGVGYLPATGNTAPFLAHSYQIDTSKNSITVFDTLTILQLSRICDQLGVAHDPATDTKQSLVRALETSFSAKYITALTVTSVAGTLSGDSLVTVTAGALAGAEKSLVYNVADVAAAPLFKDVLPTTGWAAYTSPAQITAATGKKIAIAQIITATREVLALGNQTITAKA